MFRLSVVIAALLYASSVQAEFVCYTDLSYRWQKQDKNDKKSKRLLKTEKSAGQPRTVLWARVSASDQTEELAKKKLDRILSLELKKAREACLKEHENLSGCISSKLHQNSAVLGTASFQLRKSLEEAINSDCLERQGSCGEVIKSEIKCEEEIKAVPQEGQEQAEEGKEAEQKAENKENKGADKKKK